MNMIRNFWKKAVLFLVISIALEFMVFNCGALFSLSSSNQYLEFIREENTVTAFGMSGEPGYLYVGVESYTEEGTVVPINITVALGDEGNREYYELQPVTVYPVVEKSKYLRIHSYGTVEELRITLEPTADAELLITDLIYDAKVPLFISIPRILLLFGLFCLVWCLRPHSAAYVWDWKEWQKHLAVAALILVNSGLFLFLVRSNPAFLNPVWPYHQQYHQLAVALSQGKVSIDAGTPQLLDALNGLENPYDYTVRMQTVPDAGIVWDTCFYQGKFYVYFGIVPVLVFYLPYYLIFHSAFPTWLGIFLCGVGILSGMYYLMAQIRRRWFPQLAYIWYLLVTAIGGNSLNLYCAMLHADFYYLPILMALCLTVWGLSLLMSAAESWEQGKGRTNIKLAAGALCMALTAGCRPQFLVGSFLLIPLLGPVFYKNIRSKQILGRILSFVLPYLLTAVGVMCYNRVRFGSIFDFGAAYNLTTNDMTRRGVNLGRLPDGIFMYLFQPANVKLNFPFAEVAPFYSEYLGNTVRDWTFGGVFWTHPILLVLLCITVVKKQLRQKKIYGFALLSIGMALTVVLADTQMAGILNRYCTDFLWLLILPAMIILFQLFETDSGTKSSSLLIWFVLLAGAWGIFYELAMAFRGSGLINDNVHRYYLIRALFR